MGNFAHENKPQQITNANSARLHENDIQNILGYPYFPDDLGSPL
jgi:hypothetical protein